MVSKKMKQLASVIMLTAVLIVVVLCCDQKLAPAGELELKTYLHKVVLSNTREGITPRTLHVKTGHTVVFHEWKRDRGGEPIGLQYWSSQRPTKGMGENTEYFQGKGPGGSGKVDATRLYIGRMKHAQR